MEEYYLPKYMELNKINDVMNLQEDFCTRLIKDSSQGISAYDMNLNCVIWNRAMELNTGLEKEAILGKYIFDSLPQYSFTHKNIALKVLNGQKIILRNQKYILREGYYDLELAPLYNDDREVIGGFAVVQDLTTRIEQEEENTKLKLNQQKEIMDIILYTQEEERKRIAESLHNGLSQLLYAMQLYLETLPTGGSEKELNIKSELESLLLEAIEQSRTISFELMPAVLNDFGLKTAISELCVRLSKGRLKIYNKFSLQKKLDSAIEIAIFRIIQELVNNIMKHSCASEGFITIREENDFIHINVKDNGQGFDPQFLDQAIGIGICSIRNRIKLINGEFNIISSPGMGTEVIIKIKNS